ncbi:ANTAR domain-containing protein [Streptomyces sp. NPDC046939]|uniref:ANTAR domain-containing protein n=1 Tax=Streptomyces sp. NPDC046939 TaxID=3155376 RepID=UPI0033D35268
MSVQTLLSELNLCRGARELGAWSRRCATALQLHGLAMSVSQGTELIWYSNETSARLEDLQTTLGQGPSVSAPGQLLPLQVPDLPACEHEEWQQFLAAAAPLGVEAVFVWPVRSGHARLGNLTGYRRTPGALTWRQAHDGLRIADALAHRLLAWRPVGDRPSNGPETAGVFDLHRIAVHQATGALSARLDIPVDEALLRLRARAFASGQSLTDTAHTILDELPGCTESPT